MMNYMNSRREPSFGYMGKPAMNINMSKDNQLLDLIYQNYSEEEAPYVYELIMEGMTPNMPGFERRLQERMALDLYEMGPSDEGNKNLLDFLNEGKMDSMPTRQMPSNTNIKGQRGY